MSEANRITLESYRANTQRYVDVTSSEISASGRAWLDSALSGLPAAARILEIGSGTGRDATYVASKGYSVECSDAVPDFVEGLKQEGFDARELDALTHEIEGSYDLIFANAVLLHFPRPEAQRVLDKISNALTKNIGRVALRLKQGTGEEWVTGKLGAPVYFCHWAKPGVEQLLERSGFTEHTIDEGVPGRSGATWLNIVAYKSQAKGA